MATQAKRAKPKRFLLLHMQPFSEGGHWYARCSEMNLVAQGASEIEAWTQLHAMITASIAAADALGTLPQVIAKTGVTVLNMLTPQVPDATGRMPFAFPLLSQVRSIL